MFCDLIREKEGYSYTRHKTTAQNENWSGVARAYAVNGNFSHRSPNIWPSPAVRDLRICVYSVPLCSGAVWRDPFHPSKPGRVLEVHAEYYRPAGRLPLQPGLHDLPRAAHQRPDLGARRWRGHQHAVSPRCHLVRSEAKIAVSVSNRRRTSLSHWNESSLKYTRYFNLPFLGIQSRISHCGSWATSQKSLRMKVTDFANRPTDRLPES